MLNWNATGNSKTYSAARAELLVLLEGSTRLPYVDSVGDPTIGIGFNLIYNLEPVLRVIVGNKNWSDTLLARLEAVVDKSYAPDTSATLQAALDRVMENWHNTRDSDVPQSFRLKNDTAIRKALDALSPSYEARIDTWLDGIPQSREREALFSLCWNGPSLLGPKLKAAIEAGDRAEAWYEIRYNSNGNAIAGLANRRYVEAEIFGLYDKTDKASFAEARQAGQMLARHHDAILVYESRYDPDQAGTVKGMPGIDAIGAEQTPAIRAALKALGLPLKSHVEELLAASSDMMDVNGDGTPHDTSSNDDDLVLGIKGANRLSGNGGDDIIAGMQGADTLTGGAGADIFAFTAPRDSKVTAPDTITDFDSGTDRIALAAIGDLAFLSQQGAAFTGSGMEIRWYRQSGDTYVDIDADGDRNVDVRIVLEGRLTLTETDFLL